MLKQGTVLHSIYRGVLVFVSFAGTYLVTGNTSWEGITIGSIVSAIVHFAASKLESQ